MGKHGINESFKSLKKKLSNEKLIQKPRKNLVIAASLIITKTMQKI